FASYARAAVAELDLPARGLSNDGARGAAQHAVSTLGLRPHLTLGLAGNDLTAAGFKAGAPFDAAHAGAAARSRGFEPLAHVPQGDAAARRVHPHRPCHVPSANVTPGRPG